MCAAPMGRLEPGSRETGGDVLALWAEGLAGRRPAVRGRGCVRFVFYGRVSTEDWQDPVTSRARQLQQAVMLTGGHGVIAGEFFDVGESRELPWARRPQGTGTARTTRRPWWRWGCRRSGRSPGPGSGCGPRWRRRRWSRAGTLAGARQGTGTCWGMRARTRTRPTPRGDGGRTASNPIRGPRRSSGGSSRSGWRGCPRRGSRGL
jgi:hypothetical protein